jgi:hypothetical protein
MLSNIIFGCMWAAEADTLVTFIVLSCLGPSKANSLVHNPQGQRTIETSKSIQD